MTGMSSGKTSLIRPLPNQEGKHPVLGPRLLECCRAILLIPGKSASEIMGYPDDLKLKSSMTLFALADDSYPEFRQVIDQYFQGQSDRRTLKLLNLQS
jgi:uncharacterized protein (DUF1810 family)